MKSTAGSPVLIYDCWSLSSEVFGLGLVVCWRRPKHAFQPRHQMPMFTVDVGPSFEQEVDEFISDYLLVPHILAGRGLSGSLVTGSEAFGTCIDQAQS